MSFCRLGFAVLVALLHCFHSSVYSAHLPAVRASQPRRKLTSSLVQKFTADSSDDKRALASRLLRTAASHERHSLHDVLAHAPGRSTTPEPHAADKPKTEQDGPHEHSVEAKILHAIVSHLFPSESNSSLNSEEVPSVSIHVHSEAGARSKPYSHVNKLNRETEHADSTFPGSSPAPSATSAASEEKLLHDSVAALKARSPTRLSAALRTVEELCHSIHYGRALQSSGGFRPVLDALSSRHRPVRAAAAWAVATCCQNNPPVQRAALQGGAVHTLARLAWQDVLTVRARALFALNAVLGMEEARQAFESLPFATQVVTAALNDGRDFRATRRALNLVELLVRRNLDAWKTQLEAWDVPSLVERLMREHSDIDVRESAARIIAALDGKSIS